jgi:uncharacterized protein YndB with AHSA1/START domain
LSEVDARIEIPAPLAEVWDLYFDQERWRSWVDGFARVLERADGYPEVGGRLVWESTPPGRGRVAERVLAHEERRLHAVAFEDPTTEGELTVRFEMAPASEDSERLTVVTQRLDYSLKGGGPVAAITDRLFIRSQMRGSLERSLLELRGELLASSDRDDAV